MQINRQLAEEYYDQIDHALDRPLDPMGDTYRNRYAAPQGAQASQMRKSDDWAEIGQDKHCVYFVVTDIGRRALSDYLLAIKDPHRAFAVTFGGYTSTVTAKTAAKAKYSHWLNISDTNEDLTFGTYAKTATVRRV